MWAAIVSAFDIDFIFPCYNPSENWHRSLYQSIQEIESLLSGKRLGYIIVDDGSKDAEKLGGELAWLKEKIPALRVERYETNRGKGYALRRGVTLSEAPLCVFTDIDVPYEEESVVGLCQKLEMGVDIVAGRRERDYFQRVRLDRAVISKLVRILLRVFFNLRVTDTQCGLKGFNRRGREIFLRTTIERYLFDLEFLCLASMDRAVKISPYPARLKDNVVMTKFGAFTLMREAADFAKIWLRTVLRIRH